MEELTLKEIKLERIILQDNIKKLLNDFNLKTNTIINEINMKYKYFESGEKVISDINININYEI